VSDDRALRALLERQAVEDVLYRYCSTIDQKDYGRLRQTFSDDAVGQYGDAPEMHGGDIIVKWIEEMCVDQAFQHHLINVYHVDFDDAFTEARCLTYHTSHQIKKSDPDSDTLIVGRYRDLVRKIDGTWKIVDKRMEVGWIEERHVSQAAVIEQETAVNLAAQERSGAAQ
jgi:hypothetical protein